MMEIPSELKCPLCGYLLEDAVMLPCCAASACHDCSKEGLEVGDGKCPMPDCTVDDSDPDDLIPNRMLRSKAALFRERNPDVPVRPARKKVEEVIQQSATHEEEEKTEEDNNVATENVTSPDLEDRKESHSPVQEERSRRSLSLETPLVGDVPVPGEDESEGAPEEKAKSEEPKSRHASGAASPTPGEANNDEDEEKEDKEEEESDSLSDKHKVNIPSEMMNEAKDDPLAVFNRLMAAKDKEKGIVDSAAHYGSIGVSSHLDPYGVHHHGFQHPPPSLHPIYQHPPPPLRHPAPYDRPPMPPQSYGAPGGGKRCYSCYEYGHISKDCPRPSPSRRRYDRRRRTRSRTPSPRRQRSRRSSRSPSRPSRSRTPSPSRKRSRRRSGSRKHGKRSASASSSASSLSLSSSDGSKSGDRRRRRSTSKKKKKKRRRSRSRSRSRRSNSPTERSRRTRTRSRSKSKGPTSDEARVEASGEGEQNAVKETEIQEDASKPSVPNQSGDDEGGVVTSVETSSDHMGAVAAKETDVPLEKSKVDRDENSAAETGDPTQPQNAVEGRTEPESEPRKLSSSVVVAANSRRSHSREASPPSSYRRRSPSPPSRYRHRRSPSPYRRSPSPRSRRRRSPWSSRRRRSRSRSPPYRPRTRKLEGSGWRVERSPVGGGRRRSSDYERDQRRDRRRSLESPIRESPARKRSRSRSPAEDREERRVRLAESASDGLTPAREVLMEEKIKQKTNSPKKAKRARKAGDSDSESNSSSSSSSASSSGDNSEAESSRKKSVSKKRKAKKEKEKRTAKKASKKKKKKSKGKSKKKTGGGKSSKALLDAIIASHSKKVAEVLAEKGASSNTVDLLAKILRKKGLKVAQDEAGDAAAASSKKKKSRRVVMMKEQKEKEEAAKANDRESPSHDEADEDEELLKQCRKVIMSGGKNAPAVPAERCNASDKNELPGARSAQSSGGDVAAAAKLMNLKVNITNPMAGGDEMDNKLLVDPESDGSPGK